MTFNGKACILLLLDNDTTSADRIAAAESLMYYPCISACDALWQVLIDESEPYELRDECAGSLGTLWIELGVDYERLIQVPDTFLRELLADFHMSDVSFDSDKLGVHKDRIDEALRKG